MMKKTDKPFVLHGVQVIREESLKSCKAVALVLFDVVGAEFCSKRLRAFQAILPKLEKSGIRVYGITVNKDLAATARWAQEIGVEFPLLLDVDGAVSKKYGLLDQKAGRSERALVILRNGAVSHREVVTETDVPAEVLKLIGRTST
jgi:peroxiredoxin